MTIEKKIKPPGKPPPGRMDDIRLECSGCGNIDTYPRRVDPSIPKHVAKIVMNECPECNAANGGYGTEEWFDDDGALVSQD